MEVQWVSGGINRSRYEPSQSVRIWSNELINSFTSSRGNESRRTPLALHVVMVVDKERSEDKDVFLNGEMKNRLYKFPGTKKEHSGVLHKVILRVTHAQLLRHSHSTRTAYE